MTLELVRSLDVTAVIGISGHAGCGHAHSHCGFVQDDSGGLAAVLALLQRTTGLDLTITRVTVHTGRKGRFEVETASGGKGSAAARRGITTAEARLAQFVVGRQAICTQALASTAFGRIYGQGAMEVPVALQTAIALAALNSFKVNFPDQVLVADEGVTGNCGRILGTKIRINGVVASVLAVVNASEGGLGPNEDVEGNVHLGPKKALIDKRGRATMHTLLIEGKVCADPASSLISRPTFLIRAYPDDDNVVVAQSYVAAAAKLGYPNLYLDNLLARSADAMRKLGNSQGENVIRLGKALRDAKTAVEKVRIAAELNEFCSQELGGITFMSEDVHQVMGGVGMIPGTCACLSLFIPHTQLEEDVIPVLSEADAGRFADMVLAAAEDLSKHLPEACEVIDRIQKRYHEQSQALVEFTL